MNKIIEELRAQALANGHTLSQSEQRVIDRLSKRLHISRDTQQAYADSMTVGERIADRIAAFGGSWTFILIFLGLLVAWVVVNSVILAHIGKPFDAYPFVFLNLILSMLAAIQAPVIMMSQNRQSTKDRAAAEHDYEVNLKAELEILSLHRKVDALCEQQWMELVAMQRQQIEMLSKIVESRGTTS